MSWTGKYWGEDGAVAKAEQQFENSKKGVGPCITYASVCYSAANRVFADVVRLRWSGFKHLWQGLFLAIKAVLLVDKTSPEKSFEAWVFYPNNLAEKLEIACAVYARYGWLLGGRHGELSKLLTYAGNMLGCENQLHLIEPHIVAFLKLHLIRFKNQKFMANDDFIGDLEALAFLTEREGNFAQASRIFRQLVGVVINIEHKRYYLDYATKLAEKAGATDLLVKM